MLSIRDATPDDAQAIAAIYAHYVLTSRATFEDTPPGVAEIRARMQNVQQRGLPWLVAETPSGTIAGYAYASLFHQRCGYRWTVENSVYIQSNLTGQGIGTALMRRLIGECETRGYRHMIAVIGDSANEASVRLHTALGFRRAGLLLTPGFKLGQWVDVVYMQLPLGDGARTPPAEPIYQPPHS